MKKILGIDLGGTSAKVGIVNQFGELEAKTEFKNDTKNLLPALVTKTLDWVKKSGYDFHTDIERIGFDAPGFIDHEHGIVHISGNLNWQNFPLREELSKLFENKPVSVLNDANAAALGEYWTGAASKYNSEIFYTLGTGVGGAIVLDGRLVSGEHGFAGEFGHGGHMQQITPCTCGLKECLEPVSSALGLAKQVQHFIERNPESEVAKYFKNAGVATAKLEMKDIAEVYAANNKPLAIKELLIQIYRPLLTHMAIMTNAIDPKAIIIGGGGSKMGENLTEILKEGLDPILLDIFKKDVVIETAQLGNDAGIIGAAYYAITDWEWNI